MYVIRYYGTRRWILTTYPYAQIVGDLLESIGVWPFMSELGWTAAQFDHLMEEVRAELRDEELKLYIEMYATMQFCDR